MEKNSYIRQITDGMNEILPANFNNMNTVRIGDMAPQFSATTTFGPVNLSDYRGKWLILFSHPGDFTPVCTTEFISFARYYPEFLRRNAYLLGLSIDSNPSHLAWVYNIYRTTGVQIPFPIIADRDMAVARLYGMIAPNASTTQTVRSVFIIDPEQKVRAILQYPMTNGRNIGEILRLVDALQITDQDKVVTPANWLPGQPVILPYPQTYDELIERVKNPMGYSCIDWYLCYKQDTTNTQNMNNLPDFSINENVGGYNLNQPMNMYI